MIFFLLILIKKNTDMFYTSFVRITLNFIILQLFAHLLLAVLQLLSPTRVFLKKSCCISDGRNFDHGSSFYFCFNRIWHPFCQSILMFWVSLLVEAFVWCNKETVWCFYWPYIITGHLKCLWLYNQRKNRGGMIRLSDLERHSCHMEDREFLFKTNCKEKTCKELMCNWPCTCCSNKTVVTPKTLECVHRQYL